MRVRASALASDPAVEEAASLELARSKSAVAAVVAGFFVAAGLRPDVLLGPLTLLVAGVGEGGRAFDGRLRQPGLGAKRPRGLAVEREAPPAARVALSTSVAALSVALAYDRSATLTPLARVGVAAARAVGSKARAGLLERVARVGPAALGESAFVYPFLHLASPSQGGLLTLADFVPASDVSVLADASPTRGGVLLEAPWSHEVGASEFGAGHGVCAADARGVFAALCYRRLGDGLEVPELELVAALAASPVRRGEPRVRPGTRLRAGAPVAIRCDAALSPVELSVTLKASEVRLKSRSKLKIVRGASRWLESAMR